MRKTISLDYEKATEYGRTRTQAVWSASEACQLRRLRASRRWAQGAGRRTVFAVSMVRTCERTAPMTVALAAGAIVSCERDANEEEMSEPRRRTLPSSSTASSAVD